MENHSTPREDYRLVRKASSALAIRGLAVCYVLYLLFQLVQGYVKGGDDAPSFLLLLLGIALLGGGAVAIGIWSWGLYKKDRKNALLPPEDPADEAADTPMEGAESLPEPEDSEQKDET